MGPLLETPCYLREINGEISHFSLQVCIQAATSTTTVSGFSADYIQQFVPSMMLPQPLHLMIGMIVPLCLDLAFAEKSTLLSGQRLHI